MVRSQHGAAVLAPVSYIELYGRRRWEFDAAHPGASSRPVRPAHQPGDSWDVDRQVWVRTPWPCGCEVRKNEGLHRCETKGDA